MQNTTEVKYEQENLLDKFIHNERKAKLWAVISLFAFCAAATAVLVVAYKIKDGNTVTIHEPTIIDTSKIDNGAELKNYIVGLETNNKNLQDSFVYYKSIYTTNIQQIEQLNVQLQNCAQTTPVVVSTVTVMIYTMDASEVTMDRLKQITQKSEISNNRIEVSVQQAREKNKPGIRYADSKNAMQAENIAGILNNSPDFTYWKEISVMPGNPAVMKADIEIWLGYVNVNDLKK